MSVRNLNLENPLLVPYRAHNELLLENDELSTIREEEETLEEANRARDTASGMVEEEEEDESHVDEMQIYYLLPSVFLGSFGVTLLLAILPVLKLDWFKQCVATNATANDGIGKEECHNDFETSQYWSGLFSSIRSLLLFFSSPAFGHISDVYGRKLSFRLSNLSSLLMVLGLLFTNGESAVAYYACFVIGGLIGSTTVGAYVADVSVRKNRLKNYAMVSAVSAVSIAISPLVGYFTRESKSSGIIFMVALFVLLLNVVYIEFVLPEPIRQHQHHPEITMEKKNPTKTKLEFSMLMNPILQFAFLFQSKFIFWLSCVVFLMSLIDAGVSEVAFIYLADVLHFTREEQKTFNSLYMCFLGLGILYSQLVLLRVFSYLKMNDVFVLCVAVGFSLAHLVVYVLLAKYPYEYLAYANIIITAHKFIFNPAVDSILSLQIKKSHRGFNIGIFESVRYFVGIIGPFMFSSVYSHFRHSHPEAPFYLSIVFGVLSLLIVVLPLNWEINKDI